jgi:hypothetical protein
MAAQTSIALLALGALIPALFVSIFVVEGLIVRHVCAKEGKPFPMFWFADWRWHLRIMSPAWFREAAQAGYLKLRLALYGGWIVLLLGLIVVLRRD